MHQERTSRLSDAAGGLQSPATEGRGGSVRTGTFVPGDAGKADVPVLRMKASQETIWGCLGLSEVKLS